MPKFSHTIGPWSRCHIADYSSILVNLNEIFSGTMEKPYGDAPFFKKETKHYVQIPSSSFT